MVTIVPSFNFESSFPLLSSTQQAMVGPFTAGMPSDVPLWVAKALFRRNFCQIELPEWLSVESLASILKEERESDVLSKKLPFHYFEIARALDIILMDSKNPTGRATKTVLEDLVAVRGDKLRTNFHELSRSALVHPPAGYDEMDEDGSYAQKGQVSELPIISVTGICSYELNKVGPFLQRAFSDYGFLTRRPSMEERSSPTTTKEASGEGEVGEESQGGDVQKRRISAARSRLRRFRN